MAGDPAQSRTEAATPRRREEARRKGQVAYSPDLSTSFVLFVALLVLLALSPTIGGRLMQAMRSELVSAGRWAGRPTADPQVLVATLLSHAAMATGAVVAVAMAAAMLAGISQAGLRVTFQPLSPDWQRLNLASGWKRLLSLRSAVRAAMALAKAALVAGVCAWLISKDYAVWTRQPTLAAAVAAGWMSGLKLALLLAGAMLGLAGADYLFQRQRHEADLRMTRQELIEERRDEEIDPHLRARMRRLLREAAENRSVADVGRATVVVSNPTHFAVALRYERGETAEPVVLAKGADATARRIIRKAEEHGVPVLRRPPVARALYALGEIGESIPRDLFHAVAEILAFVYAQRRGQ